MVFTTLTAVAAVALTALSLMAAERQVKVSAIQVAHFRRKEEEARLAAKRAKTI